MIAVIGITLCLPATGFLLVKNASQLSSKIEYDAQISVFLSKNISDDQIREKMKELNEKAKSEFK